MCLFTDRELCLSEMLFSRILTTFHSIHDTDPIFFEVYNKFKTVKKILEIFLYKYFIFGCSRMSTNLMDFYESCQIHLSQCRAS